MDEFSKVMGQGVSPVQKAAQLESSLKEEQAVSQTLREKIEALQDHIAKIQTKEQEDYLRAIADATKELQKKHNEKLTEKHQSYRKQLEALQRQHGNANTYNAAKEQAYESIIDSLDPGYFRQQRKISVQGSQMSFLDKTGCLAKEPLTTVWFHKKGKPHTALLTDEAYAKVHAFSLAYCSAVDKSHQDTAAIELEEARKALSLSDVGDSNARRILSSARNGTLDNF